MWRRVADVNNHTTTLTSYRTTGMNNRSDCSVYSRDVYNSAKPGFTPLPSLPFYITNARIWDALDRDLVNAITGGEVLEFELSRN